MIQTQMRSKMPRSTMAEPFLKLNIAHTRQRIATLPSADKRKDGDASESRQLEADERYLASGCAPFQIRELHTCAEGTTVGYIMPPGAK
jgi:hypothetical protein